MKNVREIFFRCWDYSQRFMAYQGTPDLETLQSFMFHWGNKITTLMQYIGIKDCNGKRIYEDDIVRVSGQMEMECDDKKDFEIQKYDYIGTVSFEKGSFVFKKYLSEEKLNELRRIFDEQCMDTDITSNVNDFLKVEVIGNIYEDNLLELVSKWEVSQVKCDLCGKEWTAVRLQGLQKLECPNCKNMVLFENL
jgi:uncharacterized phage protein (TIGR01671 family)